MILRADGTIEETHQNGASMSLPYQQDIVGGYIEYVPLDTVLGNGRRACMIVNEDGRRLGLPQNHDATVVLHKWAYRAGDILGDALLAALDEYGDTYALTHEEAEELHAALLRLLSGE